MKLTLNIKNESILDPLLWMLKHFERDGVEIEQEIKEIESNKITDEYIKEHWKELIGIGLSNYDENFYKSEQYKLDRGKYLMEKYK